MSLFIFISAIILLLVLGAILLIKSYGESTLAKVIQYIDEKDFYRANMAISKVMKTQSKNHLAHWYSARINFELKEYEKALENLKTILQMPQSFKELSRAQFHLLLADVFYHLNKPNSALNQYLLVTQYDPDNARAYARAGYIFFLQRENNNALNFLSRTIKHNPKDYYSYYLIGRIYYYMDLYPKAKENLRESIKLNKDFSEPHYYLAQLEFNRKQYQSSIRFAGKELKKEDNDKWLKLLLLTARSYLEIKNYIHAIKFFEMLTDEVPAEHPIRKEIYYYMGDCYLKLNKIEKAISIWEQLYFQDPEFMDIKNKYAQYKDLTRESIIKDIIKAKNDKLKKIYEKILEKLKLHWNDIKIESDNLTKVMAVESSKAYSYSVLVYINRSFDMVTSGLLEFLLQEIRATGSHKGLYISLADFTPDALDYVSKYPIDLINRSKLLKLLKE
ncbi:MAG: tetratricopeptide repeat protein [Spirochaetes bacterium]|nr:tetratricopeptide repeat protein [Spirochaetota bacterium]